MDLTDIRRHFEFMQSDPYMSEEDYNKAAYYGLMLVDYVEDQQLLEDVDVATEEIEAAYEELLENSLNTDQIMGIVHKINDLRQHVDKLESLLEQRAAQYLARIKDDPRADLYAVQ